MLAGVVLGLKATIQKMYANLNFTLCLTQISLPFRRTMINTVNEHRSSIFDFFFKKIDWTDISQLGSKYVATVSVWM